MVKKQTMISTGIILTLLGSNIIIFQSYINSNKENESKIAFQSKLIEQNRVDIRFLADAIETKTFENDDLLNRIDIMNQQIDKVKKENSALKKENATLKKDKTKLKKQLASRGEVNEQRKFYVEATAYTATCSEGCTGITFTEYDVRNTIYYKGMRVIASDNNVIPLYSIVRVDTKKESFHAVVLDRGGGINGFEIDLLVRNENDAVKFGRQKVLITVLKEGNS
jgi:3D (Asp-Asp-Asp) domain-containing protein